MNNDIEKTARLSKLEFDESEKSALNESLEAIKQLAKSFDELDLTDIPDVPHTSINTNVLRQDTSFQHYDRETLLCNAPSQFDGFMTVPKVVE